MITDSISHRLNELKLAFCTFSGKYVANTFTLFLIKKIFTNKALLQLFLPNGFDPSAFVQ